MKKRKELKKLKKRISRLHQVERILRESCGFKITSTGIPPITQEELDTIFNSYVAGIKHSMFVLAGVFDEAMPVQAAMNGLSAAIGAHLGRAAERECEDTDSDEACEPTVVEHDYKEMREILGRVLRGEAMPHGTE